MKQIIKILKSGYTNKHKYIDALHYINYLFNNISKM